MEGSFLSGFLIISIIILAFATIFLAYLLSERSREADTFRTKANRHIAEAAKFMNESKQNRELADLYMAEIENLKHDIEEFQEETARYKEEADMFRQKAEALQERLDALKGYEQIEDISRWVNETTLQMQNYIEEVRQYANAIVEQARQQSRAILEDKIVV